MQIKFEGRTYTANYDTLKYAARDYDGAIFGFEKEPKCVDGIWEAEFGSRFEQLIWVDFVAVPEKSMQEL